MSGTAPADVAEATRLDRTAYAVDRGAAADRAPVRIVHLGLGAFARAHQAWYTAEVDDANEWGIAAFTGRTAAVADLLSPQDGLFTLVERGPDGDRSTVVTSISEVISGDRVDLWDERIAAESTAVVTLTVTESGYRLLPDGSPDPGDEIVAADILALRSANGGQVPVSPLARLVRGLAARRRVGSGAIAVVPCDNIPGNGEYVRTGTLAFARAWDTHLADWIETFVSFVSTSVDRITPRTTADDVRAVAARTGWHDAAPVITEPYSSWTLCGDFPAGRPAWERAGAVFTDDIAPFESRKLWLLNGAHTLLAHAGQLRGHGTVADAIADPGCAGAVERFWDEACAHLPSHLDLPRYRSALLQRFGNSRIAHDLAQIEAESVTKLRVRIAPVALAELRAGRTAAACADVFAAWVRRVLAGHSMTDARGDDVAAARSHDDGCAALVAVVDPRLGADPSFVSRVRDAAQNPPAENGPRRTS
ncbi:mannitol dehydrogenase family protein [Microbacterium radiodurans]|uniref:Mannitol-1-phosphate 5-dehydrogenase n=1 Tax=Microbacterium radiodurans TaxID=661398 RepID=A0A5J5IX06_9MICO|nr:mannitol dehydrogenase family protein [Microbacterium radiodurans]KAA9089110.1 mannitol dehydrogenase family protein [Microbacterium radiodurans]